MVHRQSETHKIPPVPANTIEFCSTFSKKCEHDKVQGDSSDFSKSGRKCRLDFFCVWGIEKPSHGPHLMNRFAYFSLPSIKFALSIKPRQNQCAGDEQEI